MFDGFALSPLPCVGGESLFGFETSHRRRCDSGTCSWRNVFQCRGVEGKGGDRGERKATLEFEGESKLSAGPNASCFNIEH